MALTTTSGARAAPIIHGEAQNASNCVQTELVSGFNILPSKTRLVVEKVTLDFCVKGHYIEGDAGQYLNNVDTTVTPCGDNSYCCGNRTIGNTCCDFKEGVFLLNGETVLTKPPASKSSTPPASSIPAAATHSSSSLTLSLNPITTSSSLPGSSSSPLGSTIPASSLPLSTSPANSFPSSKPSSS